MGLATRLSLLFLLIAATAFLVTNSRRRRGSAAQWRAKQFACHHIAVDYYAKSVNATLNFSLDSFGAVIAAERAWSTRCAFTESKPIFDLATDLNEAVDRDLQRRLTHTLRRRQRGLDGVSADAFISAEADELHGLPSLRYSKDDAASVLSDFQHDLKCAVNGRLARWARTYRWAYLPLRLYLVRRTEDMLSFATKSGEDLMVRMDSAMVPEWMAFADTIVAEIEVLDRAQFFVSGKVERKLKEVACLRAQLAHLQNR
jgi:hypothetical protein